MKSIHTLKDIIKKIKRQATCWKNYLHISIKVHAWDFPGGAVVKNPPANAGDTCSSPGPGRSHMLWSN